MQIIDTTPPYYASLLKGMLRDLLSYTAPSRLKGIRMIVFEYGPDETAKTSRLTSRYSHQDGQGVVHIHLAAINRLEKGLLAADWRPWALARRAIQAVSYPLANHAHRGGGNASAIKAEARKIQGELLRAWSERWVQRRGMPSFLKRLVARLIEYRLSRRGASEFTRR